MLFEKGPRTLRPNGNGILTGHLLAELGLQDETIFTLKTAPAAINRFIYYPDHLVRLPKMDSSRSLWDNVVEFYRAATQEEVFRGLWKKLFQEQFVVTRDEDVEDESIGHFIERRFGKDLVERVVSAGFHGIYAGDVYRLSMRSLLPSIFNMEKEKGCLTGGLVEAYLNGGFMKTKSELMFMQEMSNHVPLDDMFNDKFGVASVFTLRHGLQQLVDTLKTHLMSQKKIEFLTSCPVKSIDYDKDRLNIWAGNNPKSKVHSHVISTLSPTHLRNILDKPDFVHSGLHKIGYAPTVMTVNLYFRTPDLHPPGFGYLIPLATSLDQNPERALGVVFDTGYSASLDGDEHIIGPVQETVSQRGTKLTVMLGGHYWDGWTSYPTKEEGLEMALSLLKRHLHITEEPAASAVTLARDCIPQYTVGYEDRLRTVHEDLLRRYDGRLKVAGNWIRGVGVNDCLRSAMETVKGIEERKTGLEAAVEKQEWVRYKVRKAHESEK